MTVLMRYALMRLLVASVNQRRLLTKKLFKIIKNNNDYMRKIIHGNKVINHLTANVAYQIINRFYDLRKTLKNDR